jgi:hypothetical protein
MGENPSRYSTHKRFLSGHTKISKKLNSKSAKKVIKNVQMN